MLLRPLALPVHLPGQVWLSAMPGRFEPWDRFVASLQRAGVTRIVCLTPLHEVASTSPAYQRALADNALPCDWLNLPMRDFGVAFDPDRFRDGVAQLAQAVRDGEALLLHCAAGIGRTGTVAACLLKSLGMPADDALQRVRRAGSNPQSALQSGLIDMF